MKALIVLGGDAPSEALLRAEAEKADLTIAADRGLEAFVRSGIVPDAVYGWELPPEQRKPHPHPLLDIMKRFDLTPEEILVVDDMKLACQMADPLGIKVAYSGWNGLGVCDVDTEMRAICAYSFDSTEKLYNFLFD